MLYSFFHLFSILIKYKDTLFLTNLMTSYFGSLKSFKETDYVWTLMYTVTVNQVSGSVWTVDFVTFHSFLVADAAFLKHGAAITIS